MTTSISSAEPQELKRYAELAVRIDAHLDEESARLSGILGHFAARCTEYSTGVGPHTADLLKGYARLCAPNDEWVRQVGRDFEFADSNNAGWVWFSPLGSPAITPVPLNGSVIGNNEFQVANDTAQKAIEDANSWITQQADQYRRAIVAAKEVPQVCSAEPIYEEPEKSFLDHVLEFIFGDSDKIKEFLQQLKDGFQKARQALQREWEGFVDVVKTFTPDWVKDVATAIYKVSEQIGGFFVGFAEAAYEAVTGLVTLVVDVIKVISGDEETRQKYLAIIEAFKADPIGTTKIILESIAEPIVEDWKAGRYGEAIGRVTFEILPAILAVFTGGATGAAYASKLGKAGKVADALSDAGQVVGKIDDAGRVAGKLDDTGKIANKVTDSFSSKTNKINSSDTIDITPGPTRIETFPGAEEVSKSAATRLGGSIDYGSVDEFSRPTGIQARITKDMVGPDGIGSPAEQKIRPPGFEGGPMGHARGHLLADQLGGSGKVDGNLVTLYQNPVNNPYMRVIENKVRNAVENGEMIDYKVTPIYDGNNPVPAKITIEVKGDQGFSIKAIIENRPDAPPPIEY